MASIHPTLIPLAILPPPVPLTLVRSRTPQESIPQTKASRDALLDAIRRAMLDEPVVPPMSLESLFVE